MKKIIIAIMNTPPKTEPRKRIVVSMIDYVLDIDWLTTNEFCDQHNVPKPYFTGNVDSSVDLMLQVDAIKAKKFIEYAKFLRKNLKLDMFIGDKAIFNDFTIENGVVNYQKVLSYKGISITVNANSEFSLADQKNAYEPKPLNKIEDLVGLEIEFNNKCFYI